MLQTDEFTLDSIQTPGLVHAANLTAEGAQVAEELLKESQEKYHIHITLEDQTGIFFHNHLTHHVLTMWALGATSEVMRTQHERNVLNARDAFKVAGSLVQDLEDVSVFKRCLGKDENFSSFEKYFQNQIKQLGYQEVMQRYLLDGGEIADMMHSQIYMGYTHGLIHIGLAFEFQQPLLLARGLAESAVQHDWWYKEYMFAAEALAEQAQEESLPLTTLLDMEREDTKISTASSLEYQTQTRKHSGRWAMDKEFARDGILPNAKTEIVRLAARWRVDPDDLDRATAELLNTAVYITAGAQRPPYECAFDFWHLHALNAAIGHVAFLKDDSITKKQKARLLEYTGRILMMNYAGVGTAEIRLDYLCAHKSKLPNQGWNEVFERATRHPDDGHMAKMIRSTKLAEEVSKPYDHLPEFRVKQDMFLAAGIAMIDSAWEEPMVGVKHNNFIRGAGFEGAWSEFPKRNY